MMHELSKRSNQNPPRTVVLAKGICDENALKQEVREGARPAERMESTFLFQAAHQPYCKFVRGSDLAGSLLVEDVVF